MMRTTGVYFHKITFCSFTGEARSHYAVLQIIQNKWYTVCFMVVGTRWLSLFVDGTVAAEHMCGSDGCGQACSVIIQLAASSVHF